MEDGRIKSVKYYVRINGTPVLAIKVYKTEDNKYHRFIAVISNESMYSTKTIKGKHGGIKDIKCLVSPKISVTKYLNEYADNWINTGKCKLNQEFMPNTNDFIMKCLIYNYGCNKVVINYSPKRYESNVKLFDWEFRMFHKPEDK